MALPRRKGDRKKSPKRRKAPPGPDPEREEEVPAEVENSGPLTPGSTDGRDFFELGPDEITGWKVPLRFPLLKREHNLKPILVVVLAAALLTGLVFAVVLLWPSDTVRVPDMIGKTLAKAMDESRAAGLRPKVVAWYYSDNHSDGVVLAQKPAGDGNVKKGIEVSLTVSKGPKPDNRDVSRLAVEPGEESSGKRSPGTVAGSTICLDPGHQSNPEELEWSDPDMTERRSEDAGAIGVDSGNHERLVNLDIAVKLKGLLEKDGVNVVMTREKNDVELPLSIRAEMGNIANADLTVSIHTGFSGDKTVRGTRTLYPARNEWTGDIYERSKTAALCVEAELVSSCGTVDLGVQSSDLKILFNWSAVPVIQVEVAHLTNSDDDRLLSEEDFRWKVAWGLRDGIAKYLTSP